MSDAGHGEEDARLARAARAALDAGAQSLPPATLAGLAAARRRALAAASVRREPGWLAPAAAFALAASLFAMIVGGSRVPVSAPALDDLDLLSASEPLDLYEDLEFYEWLARDGAAG